MRWYNHTKVTYEGMEYEFGWREYWNNRASTLAALGLRECGPIPNHMAFCMDGNRRFARKNSLEPGRGHLLGFESMIKILLGCYYLGVKTVSVYAFSIENFNRAPEESEVLFNLVRTKLWDMVVDRDSAIRQSDWKIKFPGCRALLEPDIIERIEEIESKTVHGTGMVVNICAPYTTRDDLATATLHTAKSLNPASIEAFEQKRYLAESEKLDILVRTSGETRFSDFMVWEVDSSCSLEFVPQLWPEFTVWKLYQIIVKWQIRKYNATRSRISLSALGASPPTATVTKRTKK